MVVLMGIMRIYVPSVVVQAVLRDDDLLSYIDMVFASCCLQPL